MPGITSKHLAQRVEFFCSNQNCDFFICMECFSGDFKSRLRFENCPRCLTPKRKSIQDTKWHRFLSRTIGPDYTVKRLQPHPDLSEEINQFCSKNTFFKKG